jgi:pimeloyl-ACP methyl ester carboxylesterase
MPSPRLVRLFILVTCTVATHAAAQDYSQPGPFEAGYREVTVTRPGGGTFGARLYYPATAPGEDATFDASEAPYPGVAFGHGFLQAVEQYQSTLEHLATWGYLVVAPRSQGGFFPSHPQFAEDLLASLTYLETENADAGSVLFGSVETSAFALSGHSMGGGASILAASDDAGVRVRALAPLAAADTNPSAIAAMPNVVMPVALIAGSEDSIVPTPSNSGAMYNNTAAPRALQVITGGFHCGFIDNNSIFCDNGSISRAEQLAITRRLLTSFLELYLRDNDDPWSGIWGPDASADPDVIHTFDSGITLTADAIAIEAPAGSSATTSVSVSHVLPSASGFTMFADGGDWPVDFDPPQTGALLPGASEDVVVTVNIPPDAAGQEQSFTISAEADVDHGTRGFVTLTVTATSVPGDLDGDGDVDLADLGILLASYDIDDGGDLDGDGDTDLADLGILLANYGS